VTRTPFALILSLAILGAAPVGAQTSRPAADRNELPSNFKRLLPRGRIAGIRKPTYVSVEEARIRPEAWVLGVEIEGEARAYSLNLLNSHEVVNDTIGSTPFAAVW
jgi:hypothetical protein